MNNYNVIPITQIGSWAEYQFPKLSPSGKHIVYDHLTEHKDGVPITEVMVDGKKIYTTSWFPRFTWINDNTISFTSGKTNKNIEVIIIDIITGEIKGRHEIKEGKHMNNKMRVKNEGQRPF